jgi:phosphatidylglycerol:prolipoprotein diacylglycerol transferase
MHPICFHIGSFPIHWYGVMVAAGFLSTILYWSLAGRKESYPTGFASDMALWIIIAGIIGARIAYVLANLPYFLDEPMMIWRIDLGGLIYYGGFIGGIAGVVLFARFHRIPKWRLGDFVISGIPLGHAFGRIGCFLNGCCYGTPCTLPWAVSMHDAVRHPTQLYEVIFNFALFAGLAWFYQRCRKHGRVLALYLLLYPAWRFCIEFLRGDPRLLLAGLSIAQWISLGLFTLGILFWTKPPGRREQIDHVS